MHDLHGFCVASTPKVIVNDESAQKELLRAMLAMNDSSRQEFIVEQYLQAR
jgi:hypothetical protein